ARCSTRPSASMSRPLVSAVIPVFNRVRSIGAAIDSALAQDMKELEVLVVDDGSTDATREVVGGHPDPRVRLIARERRGGAAAARNAGIAAAAGDYIAFLDSDDVWLPGKLAWQPAVMRR